MKLIDFTELLRSNPEKPFHLILPGENMVPVSFHITEVGYVTKRFIDCGGKLHSVESCVLQAWIGPDNDHRLYVDKMSRVLELAKAKGVLPEASEDLNVEIEYEDNVISQYTADSYGATENAVILNLTAKHTDCLAKESCLPLLPMASIAASTCGCGPGCC